MKKAIAILAFLICVLTASAGKTFTLDSGSVAPLKGGANITVSFNFDNATFDNQEPLSSKYGNLAELVAKVPQNFMQGFSSKAKGYGIVDNAANAKYAIAIKVENMDFFYSAMSFVPGYITKVWGTITVTDIATGQNVCVIRVTEGTGDRDFNIDDSSGKTFIELGENFAKIMNKGKL